MSLDSDKTIAYYNHHATEYFTETVQVDLGEQRDVFLSVLPPGGQIMDMGCGSGRDSRYFLDKGFTVDALDASKELCKLAQQFTGIPVQCCTIQEWNPEKSYEGIWACASLLHLNREELRDFFKNCHRYLKKDGILFVSAKEEIQTGTDDKNRFFTNFDETLIRELVYEDPYYEMLRLWRTQDGLGRETKWVNLLVRNKGEKSQMNSEVELETKLVGEIKGDFYIPSYQRGYRWGKAEVVRLLDDIYATGGKRNYCLQPVVVRKMDDRYELIDGQQRLTTIYLIYRFMHETNPDSAPVPAFSLSYKTKKKSEVFLKSIDESRKEENIDFWFICVAYESIKKWFSEKEDKEEKQALIKMIKDCFEKTVQIIWYEVAGDSEDAVSLFTRLNIGKIPLTNAELVKAMFLSKGSAENVGKGKQEEISLQWDNIEKELHNDSLWYFLTNKTSAEYQTRIDLVLDLISGKPADNRDKYYTFFKFDEMRRTETLGNIWKYIQHTFLILKDWHGNHEFYHKIGYLIASDTLTLQKIFDFSKGKTKNAFKASLDEYIRDSIRINKNDLEDLSYEKAQDRKKISTLLLLFNVLSVYKNGEQSQWFPFDKHKFGKGGKTVWSLEHIHAQQSEGLRTQKMWKDWLDKHISSVKAVSDKPEALIELMNTAIAKESLTWQEFSDIQQKVVGVLSEKGHTEYLHSIANLALLNYADNAVLSNSAFDVKRDDIIRMDKDGRYIPFCTRMVFLKYYTPSADNQLHFWGHADREAYVARMKEVLDGYLGELIDREKEGE